MNVKFVNPFVLAAYEVLEAEVNIKAKRGEITLRNSASTAGEITVLISMVGQAKAVVLYSMSEVTAVGIVSRIMGQPFDDFNPLAQSGIAELGNVITGRASQHMEESGCQVKISPPTLVLGKGTLISTLDFQRLVVPLDTELGDIEIHLAFSEAQANDQTLQITDLVRVGEES